MTRFSLTKFGAGACTLALCICLNAPAEAGWFSHGGSWGSHGRVYSSYGSSGGSYGSSGGSYGSHGSWGSHGSSGGSYGSSGGSYGSHGSWGWRHHRRSYSSYGSSGSHGYTYSSCGSSGGYYTTYSGSHGSHGSVGYSYSTSGTSVATYAKAKTSGSSAMLTVRVPQDAKVFVNGSATKSTGTERRYVSRGLKSGESYTYQVKVEVVRDGKTLEEVKEVKLQTGENASLAFDLNDADVETTLTVQVPEDAKVTLSGSQTESTGTSRTFTTKNLQSGSTWKDYTVQVSIERDGQTLTKSQTIDLAAGEAKSLNFDFETEAVASR